MYLHQIEVSNILDILTPKIHGYFGAKPLKTTPF
jgi:hypothetical protein